jgi:hypothetical protein
VAENPPDEHDLLRGLPLTSHHPESFEGNLEQIGKMAAGLRATRHGWRRVVARIGLATLGVAVAVLLVVSAVSSR